MTFIVESTIIAKDCLRSLLSYRKQQAKAELSGALWFLQGSHKGVEASTVSGLVRKYDYLLILWS